VPAWDAKPRPTSSIAVAAPVIVGRSKSRVEDDVAELTELRRLFIV
jgi:hypothetical protein